jgi:hypothetical protein
MDEIAARDQRLAFMIQAPKMKRALRLYACFFAAAVALFVVHTIVPEGRGGEDWVRLLFRDAVLLLAIGNAVATWGAGVHVASVYRVVWPLALATLAVCAPILLVLIRYSTAH